MPRRTRPPARRDGAARDVRTRNSRHVAAVATAGANGSALERWAPLVAALATVLLFLPSLAYGFLLDDQLLFSTSPSLEEGSALAGFTRDVGAVRRGADTVVSSYYRPVFIAI